MKAVVFNGIGDIALEDVEEPKIQNPTDAIVKVTSTAICGTDLHMVRGTMTGMEPGTILGHEAVGVVEEVGSDVRNLSPGDRVVIPSTIGCGYCSYCRAGYFAQCDNANPNGKDAGTCFFGGPKQSGPIQGLQSEYARIPFANVGPVKLPQSMTNEDAILLSDILPTSWFGAKLAEIKRGNTVGIFGAGIVGQLAIVSAFIQGAGRVLVVDNNDNRLQIAKNYGAEVINFDQEDPVSTIKRLTGGIGLDRVIDAVGVDSNQPSQGSNQDSAQMAELFQNQRSQIAPNTNPKGDNWHPGDGPSQALFWEVQSLAKAGTLGIIGVYPPSVQTFPVGIAMNKNLTINMGNCNHRKYLPELIDLVMSGDLKLQEHITQKIDFNDIISAYEAFDRRESGWVKVMLEPNKSR